MFAHYQQQYFPFALIAYSVVIARADTMRIIIMTHPHSMIVIITCHLRGLIANIFQAMIVQSNLISQVVYTKAASTSHTRIKSSKQVLALLIECSEELYV